MTPGKILVLKIFEKFVSIHHIISPPVRSIENVWMFIESALKSFYPRIRFYVCDSLNEKYYGFMSTGMDKTFSAQFDCTRENPFIAKKYPIGFNEVPVDLKHSISGNEESYLLTAQRIKGWCPKSQNCPDQNCKKKNVCPSYIADFFIDFESSKFIIDQSLTIHIPHPLDKEVPLGALSLDHGKTGFTFSEEERNALQFLVGTLLGAIIAPLIDADYKEAKKHGGAESHYPAMVPTANDNAPSIKVPQLEYEELFIKYNMVTTKNNKNLLNIFETIEKVACASSTILINGESGTGKELVARAIHESGDRHKHPFVTINCGAIPKELVESEFFGHEKGAFTGAAEKKLGKFEHAGKGTILLDEIGELLLELQVKLLRVLQENEAVPVGGNKAFKVNARVIAATNSSLDECVREKRFRKDLYYRLNVIPLVIPPLRERKEDLLSLARHFASKKSIQNNRTSSLSITPDAWSALYNYEWPGNIRELENCIERVAVLVNKSVIIELKDIPDIIQPKAIKTGLEKQSPILLYPGHDPAIACKSKEKSGDEICQELLVLDADKIMDYLKNLSGIEKNALKSSISTWTFGESSKLTSFYKQWNQSKSKDKQKDYKTFQGYFAAAGIKFNQRCNSSR